MTHINRGQVIVIYNLRLVKPNNKLCCMKFTGLTCLRKKCKGAVNFRYNFSTNINLKISMKNLRLKSVKKNPNNK